VFAAVGEHGVVEGAVEAAVHAEGEAGPAGPRFGDDVDGGEEGVGAV